MPGLEGAQHAGAGRERRLTGDMAMLTGDMAMQDMAMHLGTWLCTFRCTVGRGVVVKMVQGLPGLSHQGRTGGNTASQGGSHRHHNHHMEDALSGGEVSTALMVFSPTLAWPASSCRPGPAHARATPGLGRVREQQSRCQGTVKGGRVWPHLGHEECVHAALWRLLLGTHTALRGYRTPGAFPAMPLSIH